MKLVFLSNYFNHHQKPVSDAFYQRLGKNYVFIETAQMTQERINMGWSNIDVPGYVKYYYEDKCKEVECQNLIDSADVIIIGSAPNELIKSALKSGKIVFRYSERPIKENKDFWIKYPVRFFKWHLQNKKRNKVYLLCASAFSSYDYSRFGLFKDKAFKWGYFPETYYYDDINDILDTKEKNSILWVARMLPWKHPSHAIEVARRLCEDNLDFQLNMIGTGSEQQKIEKLIRQYGLEEKVQLIGSVKPSEVRHYMEKSEIFLFTSDHNEGWGAVLNEAMNSACAVVSNARIGSAPFLIQDKKNGLLYDENDIEKLYQNTKMLIQNKEERKCLSYNAYNTITNEWNAENAVEKFMLLINNMQKSDCKNDKIFSGVCSHAEIIKDTWFNKRRENNAKF